ncbi:MAG: tRNA (adenosine(37)-N6)-threonylcarbamoyltransferase complex ATPase subunit type 1 TsaE [Sulfurifustis sp.]
MATLTFKTANAAETENLGRRLAGAVRGLQLVCVRGPLGAGKTTLVRGLLRGLGYDGPVKSPTFTLVEPYTVDGLTLYHFDLYRINDPEEIEYLGWRDYLRSDALCVVEWPERAGALLPLPDLDVMIESSNNHEREVRLRACTPAGLAGLDALR